MTILYLVRQARGLDDRLDRDEFGLVLASPRRPARHTTELAGFADHEVDDDLVEWNYGRYEGLTSQQIRQHDPGWRIWFNGCPDGETDQHVRARLTRVVPRVRESGVDKAICFAHGHALRVLALAWLDFPIIFGQSLPLDVDPPKLIVRPEMLGQRRVLGKVEVLDAEHLPAADSLGQRP